MTGLLDARATHQTFKEAHAEEYANVLKLFSELPLGGIIIMSIGFLTPSQTPDDRDNDNTSTPIEAFIDRGRILIDNGNHRFWTHLGKGFGDLPIPVKKTRNHYLDY